MLEASADNISRAEFQKCIKEGVKNTQPIIRAIQELAESVGKPKRELTAAPATLGSDILDALDRY